MYAVKSNDHTELTMRNVSSEIASSRFSNASVAKESTATACTELNQPSNVMSATLNVCDKLRVIDEEEDVEMVVAETLVRFSTSVQNYNSSQPFLCPQAPTTPNNSPQKTSSISRVSPLPGARFSTSRTSDSISDYLSSPRTLKNSSSPRTPSSISRVSPLPGARFSTSRTSDSISDYLSSSRTLKNSSSPRTPSSISRISPPPEARLLFHQFSTSRIADAINDYVPSSPSLSTRPPEAQLSSHPSLLSMSRTLTVTVDPLMPPPTVSVSSRTASIPSLDRKTPECPNSGHEMNYKTVPRNFASARSATCFNPAEQVSTEHSSHIFDWKCKKLDNHSKQYVYPKIGSLPMAFTVTKTPSDSEIIHIFNRIYRSVGSKATKHVVPKSNDANVTSKRNVEFIYVPELNKIYRRVKLIGKGGFAKVYLVTNERTKENYACKVIPRIVKKKQTHHILKVCNAIQKIQQEIDIHKQLNHENVVKMHEAFSTLNNVYMLLEACPQKTLMHVLHYRKCLTEPETRYYMKQIVAGVEYIHSQNIIHRDLKPGNMFLSIEMIVKIGDFGLATIADKNRRMTVCGTPNYIAPEMLKQQESGFGTDIWALGCTCYALLMGQPPFESKMLNETYDLICKHKCLTIGQSLISSCGEDLINTMLRPNPEDRATLTNVKEHLFFQHYTPTYLPRTSCYQMPRNILEPSIARNQEPEPQARYPAVHPNESLRHNVIHQQSLQIQQEQPRHENSVNRCFWSNSFVFCSWRHKLNELLPSLRFRKTFFLKTDGLRKKKTNPMLMYRALNTCVKEMKPTSDNPQTVDHITPLFITKWIDFSLKYGLAFKLSDQSIGLVFNDNTKISYTHDRQKVEYATANDQIERYRRENDMPEQLKEKLKLLHRFTDYLNNRLIDGAELTAYRSPSKQKNACVPRMKRWMHIQDKGTVMELTKPLLQMNFTKDHTKIVLSYESKTTDYLVTYIDTSRQMTSYWLNDLRKNGCTADLYCRLLYLHETLFKFNEIDANTVSS